MQRIEITNKARKEKNSLKAKQNAFWGFVAGCLMDVFAIIYN